MRRFDALPKVLADCEDDKSGDNGVGSARIFASHDSQASNLRLFPSLLDGLPATESIKSDAEAPVLQLIYDRWGPLEFASCGFL